MTHCDIPGIRIKKKKSPPFSNMTVIPFLKIDFEKNNWRPFILIDFFDAKEKIDRIRLLQARNKAK